MRRAWAFRFPPCTGPNSRRREARPARCIFPTLSAEYTLLLIHTTAAHCRRIDVSLDSGAVTTILSLLSELAAAARCIFVTAWQPESGRRENKVVCHVLQNYYAGEYSSSVASATGTLASAS